MATQDTDAAAAGYTDTIRAIEANITRAEREAAPAPRPHRPVDDAMLDWARSVVPLERVERTLHIASKHDVLIGLVDDPAGAIEDALAAAAAELGVCLPPATAQPCNPPPTWLMESTDILEDFATMLHARGLAGEDRFAKVVYLATTSRVLTRPVSVAAKGPSAAGKSFTTENVLKFFPPAAYYSLSAMSDRALAYSKEPLSHRMLVIYEAAGMEGEFASYLMRSLLSEGCIRYETVEKVKGQGLVPRLIEREGPTGLIVTTTQVALHPENETRLLSVPANDTAEQTKHVLMMLACEDGRLSDDDLQPWRDLQTWIAEQDNRVHIPYAAELAERVPPVAVRLRRDFTTVLNLTKAHAVLHQATRERDAAGRIVAELRDYAAVRELVADLVSDEVGATVSTAMLETVAAVKELAAKHEAGATYLQLGERLELDKSAAMRRAKVAVSRGYLKNLETRRGQPAKLIPGEPLPSDVVILPPASELADAAGCTVARSRGGDTQTHNVTTAKELSE